MFPKKFEIDEIKNKSDLNIDHPKKEFLMVNFGAKNIAYSIIKPFYSLF